MGKREIKSNQSAYYSAAGEEVLAKYVLDGCARKSAAKIIANGLRDPQVTGPARWHMEQAAKALAVDNGEILWPAYH